MSTNDAEGKSLWMVLVPTIRNDGRPIRTRFHRVWDEKVRTITGGLTINPPVMGQWVNDRNKLYKERMIPVNIACNDEDIYDILEMTKRYYEQEKVFAYLVSETVLIV